MTRRQEKWAAGVKELAKLDKVHEGCGGTLVACVGGFYWCTKGDFAGTI